MGIRFACAQCGHVLNVKSDLAGKRGICPKCQARVDIPLESTVARASHGSSPSSLKLGAAGGGAAGASATPNAALPVAGREGAEGSWAPAASPIPSAVSIPMAVPAAAPVVPAATPVAADPIAEAPHLLWYVAPAGSTNPYGPASADMFRAWIQEGRVAADSMVWRQDWGTWLPAGEVLPQLAHREPVVSVVPREAPPGAVAIVTGPIAAGPVAGPVPSWAPAASASSQPAVAGVREAPGKRMSPFSSTNIIIVLGLLVTLLIPVVWYVLRH
jgi:hypothetical protein